MEQFFSKHKNLIIASIACSFVSSLSIISCAFLGRSDKADAVIKIVFPVVFWLGLILEQALFWYANSVRKEILKSGKYKILKGRVGVLSFRRTRCGFVADMSFVLLAVIFLILALTKLATTIQYIIISFLVLAFRMHCICNGKNFRYIRYFSKRKVKNDVK